MFSSEKNVTTPDDLPPALRSKLENNNNNNQMLIVSNKTLFNIHQGLAGSVDGWYILDANSQPQLIPDSHILFSDELDFLQRKLNKLEVPTEEEEKQIFLEKTYILKHTLDQKSHYYAVTGLIYKNNNTQLRYVQDLETKQLYAIKSVIMNEGEDDRSINLEYKYLQEHRQAIMLPVRTYKNKKNTEQYLILDPYIFGIDGQHLIKMQINNKLNDKIINSFVEQFIKLHESGFYHGDIKPGNVIFDLENQKAVIIDFGSLSPVNKCNGKNLPSSTLSTRGTVGFKPGFYMNYAPFDQTELYGLIVTLAYLHGFIKSRTTEPYSKKCVYTWSDEPEGKEQVKYLFLKRNLVYLDELHDNSNKIKDEVYFQMPTTKQFAAAYISSVFAYSSDIENAMKEILDKKYLLSTEPDTAVLKHFGELSIFNSPNSGRLLLLPEENDYFCKFAKFLLNNINDWETSTKCVAQEIVDSKKDLKLILETQSLTIDDKNTIVNVLTQLIKLFQLGCKKMQLNGFDPVTLMSEPDVHTEYQETHFIGTLLQYITAGQHRLNKHVIGECMAKLADFSEEKLNLEDIVSSLMPNFTIYENISKIEKSCFSPPTNSQTTTIDLN